MANWYKKSHRGTDEPLMDQYSKGERPSSSDHRKDPRSLVNAEPLFGGNQRNGYPSGISSHEDQKTDYEKNKQQLPSEPTLMDQDPPTGEGANDDRFTLEEDKLPIGAENKSIQLDNNGVGPFNMPHNPFFSKLRPRLKVKNIPLL